HEKVGGSYLNGLPVLIQRRGPHLDQPVLRPRLQQPQLDHLTLDAQLILGPYGSWPAELVEAEAEDAAGGLEFAVDQESHADCCRVPAAGGQSAEDRLACGLLVEMEGLRIKLGGEPLAALGVDPQPPGAEGLPHAKVFKESLHGDHRLAILL